MRTPLVFLLLLWLAIPARADALDEFCETAHRPSSIAICSDAELRTLAIAREQAYEQAQAQLDLAGKHRLLADQNGWLKSYPAACGIRPNTRLMLPLSPEIKKCMEQAGRARIAYLQNYASDDPNTATPQTESPISREAVPNTQEARSAASPDEAEAIESLRPEIESDASDCPDETITPTADEVHLSRAVNAVRVALTSSKGCFGQPGQNTYLLVESAGHWQRVLSAEPGSIEVASLDHSAAATVTLYSVGMCNVEYSWSADRYGAHPSSGCDGLVDAKATAQDAASLTSLVAAPNDSSAGAPEAVQPRNVVGTDILPLRRGFYAQNDTPCDPNGSYTLYNRMLTFQGRALNNSATARQIREVREIGNTYEMVLDAVSSGGIGGVLRPQRLVWYLIANDPEHFTLRGQDTSGVWTGSWRYCFLDLPQ